MSSPRGRSRRYKQDEKDNAVRLVRTLPHAVQTSAMAMSGAAMVRNERVRRTVVLVICSSALIEVC